MLKSSKLLWRVIVGVFLISLLFGSPQAAHGQGGETPKLDIVLVVDESGSMWFETDVKKERVNAFNMLIDVLAGAVEVTKDENMARVSVIAFGSAELTEVILPFTSVNATNVGYIKSRYREFNDKLASPPDGKVVGLKWTDVRHMFEVVEKTLGDHLPDHKPAVIILSDGKPETEAIHEGVDNFDQKIATYISETFGQAARLQSSPGGRFYYTGVCTPLKEGWVPIYTIAIREGATLAPVYKEIWRKLAEQNGGAYYANAAGLSLGGLGNVYYRIFTDLICQAGQFESGQAPLTRQYQVSNLYKRIIFTVLKDDPSVGVEIYRPGSATPMPETDPKLALYKSLKDEVWSIGLSDPWAGTWTVKLTGSGSVWFAYERFTDFFKVERVSPASKFVKACAPIDIALKITNSEGKPITSNVKGFTPEVETPDGRKVSLGNILPEGDVFRMSFDDTCVDGEYKFTGDFQIAELVEKGVTIEWPWSDTIRSVLDPYLEIVSPVKGNYPTSEPVPLQVDIKVGKKLDDTTAVQKPTVKASVYQGDKVVAGPYNLVYDGNLGLARFKSEIPAGTLIEGDYAAEFSLEVQGNPVPDVRRSDFSVVAGSRPITPTPLPTPTIAPSPKPITPTPTSTPVSARAESPSVGAIAAFLGTLGALGIAGGGAWWYKQQPSMLRLLLTHPSGTFTNIGTRFGGKFPQTVPFMTDSGQTVKLRFSPGPLVDGEPSTQVTLLDDLGAGTQIKVDNDLLSQRFDSANVTRQSQRLIVGDESSDITAY